MSSQSSKADASNGAGLIEPFRYAVVDLAIAKDLKQDIAQQLPSVAEPLFDRKMPRELLLVGPWLVRLSKAPEIESALADMAPALPWGYYVRSTVDIISLRQSLRRYNLARLPDVKKEVLFRYWDPRVMRVFLDVATQKQRSEIFAFIDQIEAADGSFNAVSTSLDIEA